MSDDNQKWRSIFGMPTDIELRKIQEEYPNPKTGDKYHDDRLAEIIGFEKQSSRFRTVIERWRRYLMRHNNLLLLRERQVGYFIADAEQRLDHAVEKKERGDRQHRMGLVVLGTTQKAELPLEKQRFYDHHISCLQRNELARLEDKRKMKILPPAAIEDK